MLGEALQQTEESGIAALEERLARRGESSSLEEAETALTSLLQKLSLKHVRILPLLHDTISHLTCNCSELTCQDALTCTDKISIYALSLWHRALSCICNSGGTRVSC